jgi:WD40 repeat protein
MDMNSKVSRRAFFPLVAGAAYSLGASGEVRIRRLKTIRGQLLDVSPDGRLACVEIPGQANIWLRDWTYDGGKAKSGANILRVVDLATGDTLFATRLRSSVERARFFDDSRRVYAETFPMKKTGARGEAFVQRVVIDVVSRTLEERVTDALLRTFLPLSGSRLLGVVPKPDIGTLALTFVDYPDFLETKRVSFAVHLDPPQFGPPGVAPSGRGYFYGKDSQVAISHERKTLVYGSGHELVCRNVSDLQVLWTRTIGAEYQGTWWVCITPDGGRVAAAFVDAGRKQAYSIGVFDGGDGSVVAEFHLDGSDWISISPDGKTIAVSSKVYVGGGDVEPTVNLYDVSAQRLLGTVSHGSTRARPGVVIGSQFCSNEKLVTSSKDVRVWHLGTAK